MKKKILCGGKGEYCLNLKGAYCESPHHIKPTQEKIFKKVYISDGSEIEVNKVGTHIEVKGKEIIVSTQEKQECTHRWIKAPSGEVYCGDCGIDKRELTDWEWLCRRCHMTKDGRIKNLIKGTSENVFRNQEGRFRNAVIN